jgi:hypothetical protein
MSNELIDAISDGWGWTGLCAADVVATSPFGHLVIRDEDGRFWYLDPELREIDRIADTEEQLFTHMNKAEVKQVWLAENLVAEARDRLGAPPPGCCYSLTPHALLAGDYSPENLWIVPIVELVRFTGSVEQQTRHLPEGTKFELKVTE